MRISKRESNFFDWFEDFNGRRPSIISVEELEAREAIAKSRYTEEAELLMKVRLWEAKKTAAWAAWSEVEDRLE